MANETLKTLMASIIKTPVHKSSTVAWPVAPAPVSSAATG
jgi:hypothetical protein